MKPDEIKDLCPYGPLKSIDCCEFGPLECCDYDRCWLIAIDERGIRSVPLRPRQGETRTPGGQPEDPASSPSQPWRQLRP